MVPKVRATRFWQFESETTTNKVCFYITCVTHLPDIPSCLSLSPSLARSLLLSLTKLLELYVLELTWVISCCFGPLPDYKKY